MSSKFHTTLLSLNLSARQVFRHFSQQNWSMLLDSGSSTHEDAQCDIIVHSPEITIVSDDEITVVTDLVNNRSEHYSSNPFDVLAQQVSRLGLDNTSAPLPFTGGAMGFFSYDLGRHCERIDTTANKDLDLPVMAVGLYRHAIVFERATNQWYAVSRSTNVSHQDYVTQLYHVLAKPASQGEFTSGAQWDHQITKQQYIDKFTMVKHHLRQGDCYQINLTQRFELDYHGDEYTAYLALAQSNDTPFSAFIRLDKYAIMSLSPERFLQTRQQQIQTKPIKGTIARSSDPIKDNELLHQLLNSEKDRSENLMIVDLLRNDIGRSATAGSVAVPKLFDIESFENVHHLVSTVTATLPDDTSPIELLRDAFPGGSITGAPKISAMNIIDKLEPNRRSIYCGSIGYISADGNMDTSITIRTLLASEQRIYAWAGGGIVADSTADCEYQECFDKLAAIMPYLVNVQLNSSSERD